MITRCGCDILSIDHFNKRYEKSGDRLLKRILDEEEISLTNGKTESMAAFFAGKEAFAKALGSGLMAPDAPNFLDIKIRKTGKRAPYYLWSDKITKLVPRLAFPIYEKKFKLVNYWQGMELRDASLSISHDGGMAMAFAVLNFDEKNARVIRQEFHPFAGDEPSDLTLEQSSEDILKLSRGEG